MGLTIHRESHRIARHPARVPLRVADAPRAVASAPEAAERWRRPVNVAVAGVALVLAAPVMVLIAILVKLTSRGPVFYTQTRVGWDRRSQGSGPLDTRRRQDIGGLPFQIYKFRSMYVNAEHLTGAVWPPGRIPGSPGSDVTCASIALTNCPSSRTAPTTPPTTGWT